jgi:hypothetical protein
MRDLLINNTPAETLYRHWASHTDDATDRQSLTVVDPTAVWAPSLLKAVADASGNPVERMSLRDSASLRAMASVQRTSVLQRDGEVLHLQHSDDSRAHDRGVPVAMALMPFSQLCSVIIGPMTPPEIDALLQDIHRATLSPEWRCPAIQFLLPHNAAWIANKVSSADWPQNLRILICQQLLTSASDVWGALQSGWAVARTLPRRARSAVGGPPVGGLGARTPPPAPSPEASWAQRLDTLLPLPGVLACAAIDATDGALLAHRTRDAAAPSMARTAMRLATWLRAEGGSAAGPGRSGADDPLEELLATTATQIQLLRRAAGPRTVYWLLLLDRQGADVNQWRQRLASL